LGVGGGVEVGEMFRGSNGGRFCRSSPPLLRSTATRKVETSVHQRIYLNCIEVDHVSVKPKLRGYFGSQRLRSKVVLFSIFLSNYEYTMGRFKSIRQTTTFPVSGRRVLSSITDNGKLHEAPDSSDSLGY
jgi:hypothetical protein